MISKRRINTIMDMRQSATLVKQYMSCALPPFSFHSQNIVRLAGMSEQFFFLFFIYSVSLAFGGRVCGGTSSERRKESEGSRNYK